MPLPEERVNQNSRPSQLKITDMRTATVGWGGWRFTLIRIDTNQGLSGYGEVRDGASKTYALMLKNRLLGENPCNLDKLFRKIKQFGHHARQGGGEWGVPAYGVAGGKFRDAVRLYCDTPDEPTGEAMGRKLKARQTQGFTFVKMDVSIAPLIDVPGALTFPAGVLPRNDGTPIERMLDLNTLHHPFSDVRL